MNFVPIPMFAGARNPNVCMETDVYQYSLIR